MAEAYRFNGPVPEAVKQLRDRRIFRASSLYARVKSFRRDKASAMASLPVPDLPEFSSDLAPSGVTEPPLHPPA